MTKRPKLSKVEMSRREAMKTMGLAAAALGPSAVILNGCGGARVEGSSSIPVVAPMSGAEGPPADPKDLVQSAVEIAKRLGATYADARVVMNRNGSVSTEDNRVNGVADTDSMGLGIRVVVNGAWGFAAAGTRSLEGVENAAKLAVEVGKASAMVRKGSPVVLAEELPYQDSYTTPRKINPFDVSVDEKVELLLTANEKLLKGQGIKKAYSYMYFKNEIKTLATSDGSLIETDILRIMSGMGATAIKTGDAQTRSYDPPGMMGGYEIIEKARFADNAERVAAEAYEKLNAEKSPSGELDLILLPSHLWLTIHESIGHATELDRVLGMEESLSGGSFATIDKLGKLKYGSPKLNIRGLNTHPAFLASTGYDDEGVKCQDWDIIKDGVLVGYSTNREVVQAMNVERSHGCSRADAWSSIPIVRMANVCQMPGKERVTIDDLIADTKNGILIDGEGSFSIDNKRLNFQFGGDAFWKIENGKKKHMLRDVTYSAITPEFWGSLDGICDEREWQPYGTFHCGKGDPMQSSQMSHACVPSRFRKVTVRRAG